MRITLATSIVYGLGFLVWLQIAIDGIEKDNYWQFLASSLIAVSCLSLYRHYIIKYLKMREDVFKRF